jgi:hypothetical protein
MYYRGNNHDDLNEEGQRLKVMIEKKKFEIPIPEITTVADLRGDAGIKNEESK